MEPFRQKRFFYGIVKHLYFLKWTVVSSTAPVLFWSWLLNSVLMFFSLFAGLKERSWVVKTPSKTSRVTRALRHSAAERPKSVLKMTTSWLFWEGQEVPRLVVMNESQPQSSSEAPSPQLPSQQTWPTAKIAMYSHMVHNLFPPVMFYI